MGQHFLSALLCRRPPWFLLKTGWILFLEPSPGEQVLCSVTGHSQRLQLSGLLCPAGAAKLTQVKKFSLAESWRAAGCGHCKGTGGFLCRTDKKLAASPLWSACKITVPGAQDRLQEALAHHVMAGAAPREPSC